MTKLRDRLRGLAKRGHLGQDLAAWSDLPVSRHPQRPRSNLTTESLVIDLFARLRKSGFALGTTELWMPSNPCGVAGDGQDRGPAMGA